jgi:hypothetical protein
VKVARPEGLEPPTLCLEGRCTIHLCYGRVVYADSKSFITDNDTVLQALTFYYRKGRRSVVISCERARMNLEHLEALAPEIHLVLQQVLSVHSVQFGPQGQVGSDWSSQEVLRRATSHY